MNKTLKIVAGVYVVGGIIAYMVSNKTDETYNRLNNALVWPLTLYHALMKPLPRSPGSIYGDTSGQF